MAHSLHDRSRFGNLFRNKTLSPDLLDLLKNLRNRTTNVPSRPMFTRGRPTIAATTLVPSRQDEDSDNQKGNSADDNSSNSGNLEKGMDEDTELKKIDKEGDRGRRHDGNDDDDHDYDEHTHSHGGRRFKCQPISSKHSQYIQDNLERLQKQCQEFSACTEELYSAENYHLILSGESTRLRNICGLMYANGGGQYTTLKKECSAKERRAIRQTIGRKLGEKLAGGSLDQTWKKLDSCIVEHQEGNEPPIDTVCRLRSNTTAGSLCDSEPVNRETRDFFNHELEHLHCSCVAIDAVAAGNKPKPTIPKPARMAIAGGIVGLLVVLIIAVIILFIRHRKTKRKLKEHRKRYPTAAVIREESSTVYQEIHDAATARPKLPSRQEPEGKLLPQGYQLDVAPTLPVRYVKGLNLPHPSRRTPSDEEDRPHSYLEPLPDPVPAKGGPSGKGTLNGTSAGGHGKENNSYSLAKHTDTHDGPGAPYSLAKHMDAEMSAPDAGYSLAKHVGEKRLESEGTYFDTIKLTKAKAEDEYGYSKLRSPAVNDTASSSTAGRESSAPQYFELETEAESAKHGDGTDSVLYSSTKL